MKRRITPYTIEEMHQIAQSFEGKCLSTEYNGINQPLKWACKNGHTWESTPSVILKGILCPRCPGGKKYEKGKKLELLIKKRKGKVLTKQYESEHTKMEFQCENGHIFIEYPAIIKNRANWCPRCLVEKMVKKSNKDTINPREKREKRINNEKVNKTFFKS